MTSNYYQSNSKTRLEKSIKNINHKPLVTIVIPAYNEAEIIANNLEIICQYMETLEDKYDWEMIVVNDGSKDDTGEIAEEFASNRKNVYILHHMINFGMGQALKYGFNNSRGDYIITLDLDLSYSPEHIERLLSKIVETRAKVVVASPYMKGGKISNVPWLRKELSIWGNIFLALTAKQDLKTLTGVVRAYDGIFLRSLHLKSAGMEINPEVIHKARILRAKIEEIPAYLKWHPQKAISKPLTRRSSMKILAHTWVIIIFGFLFRPVMFFVIPGIILFLMSCYANIWVLIHVFRSYYQLAQQVPFPDPTDAVREAFYHTPHTFIMGGMTLMLSIQLISLGILSLQSKMYFEEIFYLITSIYKSYQLENKQKNKDK